MNILFTTFIAFLLAFATISLGCTVFEQCRQQENEKQQRRRNIKAQQDLFSRAYVSYDTASYPFDSSPDFSGAGEIAATHELHCFMFVNPTPEQVKVYKDRVDWWNKNRLPLLQQRDNGFIVHNPMKAPVLTLMFRKPDGSINPITVCQSARHIQCNNRRAVLEIVEEDKEFFENTGVYAQTLFKKIDVCRIKVEATAHGVNGVPQNAEEAKKYPQSYFEVHMRVHKVGNDALADRKELPPITRAEQAMLEGLTKDLTIHFGFPIPLSLNVAKGHQRFVNARFYSVGLVEIQEMLQEIRDAIEKDGIFVAKEHLQILEYVWFDTQKQIDAGWIDFTKEEFDAFQTTLVDSGTDKKNN